MGLVFEFLYQKLVLFVGIICFSLYTYLLPLFGSHLFRKDESSKKENSENREISNKSPNEGLGAESKSNQDFGVFTNGFGEKVGEKNGLGFQFKFPTYEEFCKNRGENVDFPGLESVQNNTTMKFEFTSEESLIGFIEKPEIMKNEDDYIEISSGLKAINEELPEETEEKEEFIGFEGKLEYEKVEIGLNYEKGSSSMDSESESICSTPLRSIMDQLIDSCNDGFLSDNDFLGEFDELSKLGETNSSDLIKGEVDEEHIYTIDELRKIGETHFKSTHNLVAKDINLGVTHFENSNKEPEKGELGGEEHIYTIEELKKIEEDHMKHTRNLKLGSLSEQNIGKDRGNEKTGDLDDPNDLESLWEHQELIEQLKMELKKVRATGLPTILEESESLKITDDLKPWKIDEKFEKVDHFGELHKFYKSYRDKMRKLDILNYQKMYAIGFLQLKDPLQSISSQKSSVPSATTLLSHNLFPSKRKRIGNNPMMKFVLELQGDFEIVYVGQMCLSWEILCWQYGKALELWELDPRGIRIYNEVADDFQQFQVLMQRFIEDEPFQGPRVQNYVKSRCVLRNLLQVPLVREDKRKKTLKRREMGDFAITSDMLVETLEESIRIFWRFIRADKDCSNVTVKSRKGLHIDLQDPADFQLLMEVQTNLHKKEKKLKDLLRSGNCILKKFKKCQEDDDDSDQVLYFFSQVDMKLVARVLNMPRITTDQLIWCRDKLRKISFVSKKIQVEPSFLLFPC